MKHTWYSGHQATLNSYAVVFKGSSFLARNAGSFTFVLLLFKVEGMLKYLSRDPPQMTVFFWGRGWRWPKGTQKGGKGVNCPNVVTLKKGWTGKENCDEKEVSFFVLF